MKEIEIDDYQKVYMEGDYLIIASIDCAWDDTSIGKEGCRKLRDFLNSLDLD